MVTAIFWACCLLLVYVYVLYPTMVRAIAHRFSIPVRLGVGLPTVTIVVTAYNEEACIRDKLDNLASLDYPRDLVTIIVASDGSTDATEEIARGLEFARTQVLRIEGRRGKTECQNAAAEKATGDVIVFTDATTRLHPTALNRLVENFGDESVGCVGGRLVYVTDIANITGRGGEAYWSYELKLRAAESSLGSLIGVSGCLYAVRRTAYRAIDPELISDFVVTMKMREQSLRTILAPEAICYETTLDKGNQELAMRVRVAVRSLNALIRERRFLNPVRYGLFAWQLWSHKVLRYASPLLWAIAFVANVALSGETPYLVLLVAQTGLLASGAVGFFLQDTHRDLGVFGRPYYFLLTNLASLIATLRYLRASAW